MILTTVVHRHKHLTMLNQSIIFPSSRHDSCYSRTQTQTFDNVKPINNIPFTVVHRHKHLTMLNQSITFPSSRHDSCYSRTQTQTFDNVKQVNNIPFL